MEKKTINLGRVGFAPKGAYSPEVTYGRMHVVTYKNTTYWSKQEDNLNHEPNGETEWWGVLVDGQAAYNGANDAVKATERANTAAEKADAATEKANSATSKAVAATDTVNTAVTNANDATAKAKKAAEVCEAIVPVEDARVKAESSRVEAENSRISAEQSRATAEQSRIESEQQRTAAEAKRNTDELSRQSNETDRKEAEAARVEAEQGRVDAENQRSASEESRFTAESGRVTAENARVAAENSRVSAEQTREQSFTAKVGEVDTAIKNCNTATQGAEKVDATITEANVLQVTDRNGTQKTLDLAAVAKANSVAEDVESLKETTDTLKRIDNRDISTEYKLEDYRIWKSKEGDFSLNSWFIFNCQNTGWKSKAFPKMDISNYDSVKVSAIISGVSMSTSTRFTGGLHVFVNGGHKLGVNTPQTYTIYPQQLKENDSDEVVMLLSVQSGVTPYIKVNKKGIAESKDKDITKIVICGDSLCGNKSALIVKELNSILTKYSYALIPRTKGGENMIGNLTRAGGLPIRVTEEFTIPADKSSVNIKLTSGWIRSNGNYASNPYSSISDSPHNVQLNGIEGNLQKIVAYGMCTYDSNKKFIQYYTSYPINMTTDSNVAYVRFCANNPQVGVTHITIGGEAQDVNTLLSLDGSLDYTGTYQENSAFKTSDFIAVNNTTIYADALAVSDTYTFIRNEEGTARKCGKFNIGWDSALHKDQDAVHIWFTGQNGGYDTDEEWAEMIEQAARNFGEKFIVCSTALDRTTNSLVYAAQRKFGKRYLNLRDYTQNQAVYDGQRFGLIDSSKVASDYSTLFWGSDKVHQNNLLSYLWSVKMWNMIIDFGWMKGERVEDGSLYVK